MPLTPQEEQELAMLESQYAQPKASNLTPSEEAELAKLEADHAPGILSKAKDLGAGALDYGLRGLDYAGGLTRTGAADLADTVTGGGKVTGEDWKSALKGQAKPSSMLMDQLGVPEGGKVNLFPEMNLPLIGTVGKGETSARDVGGFVGDIVLDPLTYLSGGISAWLKSGGAKIAASQVGKGAAREALANYAGKAIGGVRHAIDPSELIGKGGRGIYNSAYKKIDSRLAEKGIEPISTDLWNQGFWGGNKGVAKFSEKRLDEVGKQRTKLYQEADQLGQVVHPHRAEQQALDSIVETSGKGYGARKRADDMLETLSAQPEWDRPRGLSLEKASDIKTSLYDQLPQSAFDPFGRLNSDGKKMLRDLSFGYKNEIISAGNTARPSTPLRAGLGDEIDGLNQIMGPYIAAKKPTQKEIAKESRKDWFTQTKAVVAKLAGPATLGGMYAAQAINSPTGRSLIGKGVYAVKKPVGEAIRRKAINENSTWDMLSESQIGKNK